MDKSHSNHSYSPTSFPFKHYRKADLEQTEEGTYKAKGEKVRKKFTALPLKPTYPKHKKNPLTKQEQDELSDDFKFKIIDERFAPKSPPPKICYTCGSEIPRDKEHALFHFGRPLDVCMNCYTRLPECRHCGFPVRQPITGVPVFYCTFCKEKGICSCCADPIDHNHAVRFPHTRGSYCIQCTDERPACFGCGRLIPEKDTITLDDGRSFCLDCNDRTILTEVESYRILNDLKNFLKIRLGVVVQVDLEVQMIPYSKQYLQLSEESYMRFSASNAAKDVMHVTFATPKEKIIYGLSKRIGKKIFQKFTPAIQYTEERADSFSIFFAGVVCKWNHYYDEYFRATRQYSPSDSMKRLVKLEKHIGFKRLITQIKNGKLVWER